MTSNSQWLDTARAQWHWREKDRPHFADVPAPGQVSVWGFPRPPQRVREAREIVVLWGHLEVARTHAAWAVRETAHPPTFYIPLADVQPAHHLDCRVGGLKDHPQAGPFHGGWITPDLAGPFKGGPGSGTW